MLPRGDAAVRPAEADLTTPASQNLRYDADENPPLLSSIGYGVQFSLIASATLLVTPVIVAQATGQDPSYLTWMVFASLLVIGVSTIMQARAIGPVGARAFAPMFTAAFSIPFCIAAVQDGGPILLSSLVLVTAAIQLVIAKWLFLLRRIVTPIVGGTVMMILSITLASVVFDLLDRASLENPIGATSTAFVTLVVVAALSLRGSNLLRLWGPVIGIVAGCIWAAVVGIYDPSVVIHADWVGLPREWPGLDFEFGFHFWTLLPSFIFMGLIISIQTNGAAINLQRASRRTGDAVDFRKVQGSMAGGGATNLLAGLFGAVPNIINPGVSSFIQTTGVASRRVGYCIGFIFIAVAFVPKLSGLLSTIPGPVMTGYLLMVTGTLFADGARTVIQGEADSQKLIAAGVCFWIGAAFQFGLFHLPDLGPVWAALFKSGITTGGLAAVAMILYLEFTNPRRMRFHSKLDIDALPELNKFLERFAARRGWDDKMKERLSQVSEETLLILAPLDLELDLNLDALDALDEPLDEPKVERRLVVVASSDQSGADLEFIGSGGDANIEDQVRQLQQHDSEPPEENEMSLRLLRGLSSSVRHQQYHDTDVITVRVTPPA